jgi:hypothetical protein
MSTLIWPDSEDFLRNIMSYDTMTWDNSLMGAVPAPPGPYDSLRLHPPNIAEQPPTEHHSPAEDGHRAVQAVSGLIASTVSLARFVWHRRSDDPQATKCCNACGLVRHDAKLP